MLARVIRWRLFGAGSQPGQSDGQLLIVKVTDGPKSQIGREIHVPVTEADLPVLEGIVAAIKARRERDRG